MEALLEKISKKDQKIARELRNKAALAHFEISQTDSNIIPVQVGGHILEIPRSAIVLFFKILDNMGKRDTFAVYFSDNKEDISTQQAAEILGVSRPHLVSLLEKGDIPYKKVGTHRRIQLKDIVAYDKKVRKNRSKQLKFLVKQAQELNLY
ncbi:helix-turn-helix domain-containing protein [Chitinophaga filiformis]|uniref:Helix-turn-helix domain-containing protein n=1 Tax=Chitinophaga filiformis TaxID=104663 RepID=A0ABY4I4K6_CHIFI|nr:helix-turn-helix domain-containing protein [Chitinophaga filiformis]UPK70073.1 helix-turn-helix domain-containing protein [Chitinophaga filiformis]